jgi:hypothetical protein
MDCYLPFWACYMAMCFCVDKVSPSGEVNQEFPRKRQRFETS